jgi:hypothetical protein
VSGEPLDILGGEKAFPTNSRFRLGYLSRHQWIHHVVWFASEDLGNLAE